MPTRANPDDEATLTAFADALADAIVAALAGWVHRCVARFVVVDGAVAASVAAAGRQVQEDVGGAVRELLALDIDQQRTTPLALLRRGVAAPTAILRDLGVAPVVRDEFEQRSFPDDVYRLTPATFADVDPTLQEPGLQWGAAKAFVFKQRRRMEGRT